MFEHILPMTLGRCSIPFDDTRWIYELKLDGFRALAYVDNGGCRLVSRNNHNFRTFDRLREAIARTFPDDNRQILDGEIVCLSADGCPQFYDLLHGRGEPLLFAFDLLWLNDVDLRDRPLLERKRLLREIIPRPDRFIRYVEHFEQGCALYKLAVQMDMEGIVAKKKDSLYALEKKPASWLKIKNPAYSQAVDRAALFERHTGRAPLADGAAG